MTDQPSRRERRAARTQGHLDTTAFVKTADKFIAVANRENQTINATELQMAFLWAAARYNAHVAKVVIGVEDQEAFVQDMSGRYAEMLRQHLADPSLGPQDET